MEHTQAVPAPAAIMPRTAGRPPFVFPGGPFGQLFYFHDPDRRERWHLRRAFVVGKSSTTAGFHLLVFNDPEIDVKYSGRPAVETLLDVEMVSGPAAMNHPNQRCCWPAPDAGPAYLPTVAPDQVEDSRASRDTAPAPLPLPSLSVLIKNGGLVVEATRRDSASGAVHEIVSGPGPRYWYRTAKGEVVKFLAGAEEGWTEDPADAQHYPERDQCTLAAGSAGPPWMTTTRPSPRGGRGLQKPGKRG